MQPEPRASACGAWSCHMCVVRGLVLFSASRLSCVSASPRALEEIALCRAALWFPFVGVRWFQFIGLLNTKTRTRRPGRRR